MPAQVAARACCSAGEGGEGNFYGNATGLLDGGEIGGEIAPIVVEVGAGGGGNGDAGGHG